MLITLLATALAGPVLPAPVRLGTDRFRHGGIVRALAVHPRGTVVASAGHDRLIDFWDLPAGSLAAEGRGHEADVTSLAWSPDGRLLASGAGDGTVRLWDRRGRLLHTLEMKSDSVSVVAWSPDGRTLAAGLDNGVALIDPSTAKQTATLVAPEAVRSLAWSPDGSQIAVNGGEKAIALLDRATGKSRAFGTDGVYILAWAGKRLASWSPDSGVRLFNPITGALEQTWDTNPASPLGGATGMIYQMSVEGDRVAIGTVDGAVLLFRLGEAKPLARATGHVGRVPAVQFAGKWLVSAGADSTLRLWDAATLKPVSAASPLEQPVADVAIMGKKLHVQFADDSVCVYDRALGTWNETSSPSERRLAARESLFSLHLGKQELRRDEKVLATGIRAMTVSADGSTLLTRDDTGSLSVRDVQGKVLRTLVNVEKNQQLLLSPRGTRILRNARRHFSSC